MDLLQLGAQSRKTGIKPKENLAKDKFDMEDIDEFFEETTWLETKSYGPSKRQSQAETKSINSSKKRSLGVRKIYPINLLDRMTDSAEYQLEKKGSHDKDTELLHPAKSGNKISNKDEKIPSDDFTYPEIEPIDMDQDLDLYEPPQDFDDKSSEKKESGNPSIPDFTLVEKDISKDNTKEPFTSNNFKEPQTSKSTKNTTASKLSKNMALTKPKVRKARPKIYESDNEDNDDTFYEEKISEMPSSDSDDFSDLNYNTQESKISTQESRFSTQSSTKSQISKSTQDEYITEPSPLPSPPPEGLRRSRRKKIAPLAYWRNERIVYSRANEEGVDPDSTLVRDIRKVPLQEIREVVHIPEKSETVTASKTKKPKAKKRSKQDAYDYESDPEIEGSEWFKSKSLETEVFENEKTKKRKIIAWAPDGGSFQSPPASKNGQQVVENFRVAPLFDADSDLIAAGLLDFPFEGFKSLRTTGESSFIFHVAKGLIEVTLNSEKFVVTRGCSLEVPKYNIYSFRNIGQGSARLFFVQCQLGDS